MKYEIKGTPLPVVVCELSAGEKMITEKGSMSWMSPNMKMETSSNGGARKALGRMFAGEAIFQNSYTAQGGDGMIAFASSFPGSILAFEIAPGNEMIVQKSGFLASEAGVELSVFFEIDGSIVEYELQAGESMIVDTGYLAAMSASCTIDVQSVPGIKNMLFGGEGVFNTIVRGPGRIILQTLPVNAVAAVLRPFFPSNN